MEEQPLAELDSNQFFSEPDQAYSAVNSLYRTGAPNMTDGGVYSGTPLMLGGYMSGYFYNEYAGQELHVSNSQELTLNGDNIGSSGARGSQGWVNGEYNLQYFLGVHCEQEGIKRLEAA